jgi:hypothetical protein
MFMPYFVPILVSYSSDDDSQYGNPPPHTHLLPYESNEHEPTLELSLPRWVRST